LILSLDFQPLGWRVDPGGGWFEWRFWRLSDEAFWVRLNGHVESFLAGCVDLVGLTVVDLVWRHEADARMVVILITPIEETAAEGLRILDAAELVTPRSASNKAVALAFIGPPPSACLGRGRHYA
jgi:hypothetical protein